MVLSKKVPASQKPFICGIYRKPFSFEETFPDTSQQHRLCFTVSLMKYFPAAADLKPVAVVRRSCAEINI